MKDRRSSRWAVLAVLTLFTLLHQADRLLIGPLTSSIMASFRIDEGQMGAVVSGALIVSGLLFPVWGYLFDRFSRARLIALAATIWGATTWLSALAPTFGWFVMARAATGVDDASTPGVYSLLADTFDPRVRGRVYALLKTAMPAGYVLGAVLATTLAPRVGWRWIFVVTGGRAWSLPCSSCSSSRTLHGERQSRSSQGRRLRRHGSAGRSRAACCGEGPSWHCMPRGSLPFCPSML